MSKNEKKLTKTDNILRIISVLRNGAVSKKDLIEIIGTSKSQSYKIIAEFKKATDVRPPVLIEYKYKGEKFIQLSSFIRFGEV
jgi:chromosome segregation and condensation protein ScpB